MPLRQWQPFTDALAAGARTTAPRLRPYVIVREEAGRVCWGVWTDAWPAPHRIAEVSTSLGNAASIAPRAQTRYAHDLATVGWVAVRLQIAQDALADGTDPDPALDANAVLNRAEDVRRLAEMARIFRGKGWPWPPAWARDQAAYYGVPVPLGTEEDAC